MAMACAFVHAARCGRFQPCITIPRGSGDESRREGHLHAVMFATRASAAIIIANKSSVLAIPDYTQPVSLAFPNLFDVHDVKSNEYPAKTVVEELSCF